MQKSHARKVRTQRVSAKPLIQAISILVVDDDEWIRDLMVHTLTDHGYLVEIASNAEDALRLTRSIPFDLVLSDVRMPGMDGIEFSRILHRTHPAIPVVLLTGFGHIDLARLALREGASDFITKPFNLDTISIIVERNLERKRLEVQKALEQDSLIMFKTIQALVAAIDARQKQTALHSKRVTDIAMALGKRIGLNNNEMQCMELAAHVHDVGKIAVPDNILNKCGSLTPEEWVTMRIHSEAGADIVGQVNELSYISDVVRHHHEKVDGSGYPDGLKGESIPVLSRIIAVADAYECMISDRPYRSRLSEEVALVQLAENAGTQFDKRFVEVFLDMLSRNELTLLTE